MQYNWQYPADQIQTVQMYPMCPTTNYYVVREGDTFDSIADYFNISSQQLLYSNYGIDLKELYIDQILCIPSAPSPVFVIIGLKERKLKVFKLGRVYREYGISFASTSDVQSPSGMHSPTGDQGPSAEMPTGTFTVVNKQLDTGIDYGARWLGLSEEGIGIHSISTPDFIKASAKGNCILLSDKDMSELFNLVPVGTIVSIFKDNRLPEGDSYVLSVF